LSQADLDAGIEGERIAVRDACDASCFTGAKIGQPAAACRQGGAGQQSAVVKQEGVPPPCPVTHTNPPIWPDKPGETDESQTGRLPG